MKALRLLVLGLVAWGCATNPATGRREVMLMSEQQEIALGRQNDAEVRKEMGVYDDPNLQQYVASVGAKLARQAHRPTLPWTYTIVDEPAVNAFALPGGFIYITRGILPFLRNEAELAAVLGHETGHVDARHSAQQYSTQTLASGGLALLGIFVPETRPAASLANAGLQLAFLKFSREDELEADRLGVGYEARAGWDPHAMSGLLSTLASLDEAGGTTRGIPNWALTHPPAADRVQQVQQAIAAAPAATTTNAAAFDQHLPRLVYGDSREKGIVRGNEFLHPILRFALTFPSGWQVQNGSDQVTAVPGDQSANSSSNVAMLLELAADQGPLSQSAPAEMSRAGWQPLNGEATTINGLDAYVGTYRGAGNNANLEVQAAHVRSGNQTFVVAGVAPAGSFGGLAGTFLSAIRSFRPLSQEEADRIQPSRVDFYVARTGDTWASLARRSNGAVDAKTLAIMNGSDPASSPRAGDRVRIVVGG